MNCHIACKFLCSLLVPTALCICFTGCERILPGVQFGPDATIEVHTATSTHQRAVFDLEQLVSSQLQRPCMVTIIDLPISRPEGYRWQQATVHVAVKPGETTSDASESGNSESASKPLSDQQKSLISQQVEQYLADQVVGPITVVIRSLQ